MVKMARKSAKGVAKYSASKLVNCGNHPGNTSGSTRNNGMRNRIWRVSDRKDGFRRLACRLKVVRSHNLESDERQHGQLHFEGKHREAEQAIILDAEEPDDLLREQVDKAP